MAIAFVQSTTGAGATLVLSNFVAGNALLFVTSYNGTTTPVATPTDSNGTFHISSNDTPANLFGGIGTAIFDEQNAAAGTHTVTPQSGVSHNSTLAEFSGLVTVGMFDVAKSANSVAGGQTSQSTGTTGVTAQASELSLIAFCDGASPGAANMGLTDPVTNYTTLQLVQDSSANIGTQHAYRILSATGAQTATFNWTDNSAGQASMGCIATFKAAAAGGGGPNRIRFPAPLSGVGSGNQFFGDRLLREYVIETE